uniref:ANK_REP_REGION domain-containing protein n=1 Tax=Rhabditophanes sp. KR3021 TaxID=114890 RepID=A0AC35TW30_9BILA
MARKGSVTLPLKEYNPQSTVSGLSGVISNFADIALGGGQFHVSEYFNAAEYGLWQNLEGLHRGHVNSLRNTSGETLLIVAAKAGHINIVRQLIEDSDVDESDNEGWSALLNAAANGHTDICKMLIENGASIDLADLMGWTPLMWAVYKNHRETVALLLNYKVQINIVDDDDGLTPLILSAGRGYQEIVKLLLENGAAVNSCDKFGSTSLIWASRKGYLNIVEILLNDGCEVDAVGMYGSTALMLATKGNFIEVVEKLLSREPNVNVVDYNGLSALAIACREGYEKIAEILIQSGAFVNLIDRYGNSILASAVRSGSCNIVRMLLEKYSDVNTKDSESRTPLHLAIDKSYIDMVVLLLEKKPNLEVKNKDGETPLFRAVKNRHVAIAQLLVNAGAKVSAQDKYGENSLHLSLRARSKRMTQLLLSNPSDSKLLYRPNKLTQTPYSIDQENPTPIMPQIFGSMDSDMQVNSMLGYDIYSDVMADVLCDPQLKLPLTIGFFSRWGNGKSFLLPKMRDSMVSFSRTWLDGANIQWSWAIVTFLFVLSLYITLIGVTIAAISESIRVIFITGISGSSLFIILTIFYFVLYHGNERKTWQKAVISDMKFSRFLHQLKLIAKVLTLNAPKRSHKELTISPVSFLFADDHKLCSVGSEHSLTAILTTLYDSIEEHFGPISVRLLTAINPMFRGEKNAKFRTYCCFPAIVTGLITLLSLGLSLFFAAQALFYRNIFNPTPTYTILSIIFIILFGLLSLYPCYVIIVYLFTNIARRRMKKMDKEAHTIPFERLIQKLQREVHLLSDMVKALDAFTNSQTRLVVMVDGMDNNENSKIVQILDALTLLFGTEPNSPFVLILAVDRHIIVNAATENIKSSRGGQDSSGTEYVKSIVSLPFYIHNQNVKQMIKDLKEKGDNNKSEWLVNESALTRRDTISGSRLSLSRDNSDSVSRRNIPSGHGVNSTDVATFLLSDEYFSNMNPRSLRRIVHSMIFTGRLLRSFDIEFGWVCLGIWIGLIEQWPFRISWLIEKALTTSNDNVLLYDLYRKLKHRIPVKHDLAKLDKNGTNFEKVLKKTYQNSEQLTVGKIRKLLPCTCNLDPYLRKLIAVEFASENYDNLTDMNASETLLETAQQCLLKDPTFWTKNDTLLMKMKCGDFMKYVDQLEMSKERRDEVGDKIKDMNLTGIVLMTCDLADLQKALDIKLGDWHLLKLLIETLRKINNAKVLKNLSISNATQEALERLNATKQQIINDEAPESASVHNAQVKKIIQAQNVSVDLYEDVYSAIPNGDSLFHDFSKGPKSVKSVRNDTINEVDEVDSNKSNMGSRESLIKFDDDIQELDTELEEVGLLSKEGNEDII